MKYYEILSDIMLGFLSRCGTVDYLFGPTEGWVLECNEHTIWVKKETIRHESITMANAVPIWLAQGKIKEINENH